MDSNNHVAYSKEHIRFAVLSFFLAQGLCFSSWASRIPDIKEIFTVNDALYWGIVLFMIPVGKFVAIRWRVIWCRSWEVVLWCRSVLWDMPFLYLRLGRH